MSALDHLRSSPEVGKDPRECRGVFASLLKFHEPFPRERNCLSDFVGFLIGAFVIRKGDTGAHFDFGDNGEKGSMQVFGGG